MLRKQLFSGTLKIFDFHGKETKIGDFSNSAFLKENFIQSKLTVVAFVNLLQKTLLPYYFQESINIKYCVILDYKLFFLYHPFGVYLFFMNRML